MNGSYATISMPIARARSYHTANAAQADDAECLSLKFNSNKFLAVPTPGFETTTGLRIERASEMSKAIVCSAVVIVLPSGAFITTMPRIVAAFTSMLSTPTPARPMTRKPWPPRAAQELPWFRSALSGLHNPLVPRVNRTARARGVSRR